MVPVNVLQVPVQLRKEKKKKGGGGGLWSGFLMLIHRRITDFGSSLLKTNRGDTSSLPKRVTFLPYPSGKTVRTLPTQNQFREAGLSPAGGRSN